MLYGRAFCLGVTHARHPSIHTVTVCVRGQHVQYSLRVGLFAGHAAEARLVEGVHSIAPCDGSCKGYQIDLRLRIRQEAGLWGNHAEAGAVAWMDFEDKVRKQTGYEKASPSVREYLHILFEDGDSDEAYLCSGQYHARRVCMEFGMGGDYIVVGHCDQTCRPCRVRLPSSVARRIHKHG